MVLATNLANMENIDFSNKHHVGHLIKGSYLGASYTKSAPCLVWCRYVFCWLRYVFYLSSDLTKEALRGINSYYTLSNALHVYYNSF